MITDRDYKVVEFVSKLPCYSDTIQKIFFSNTSQRVTNRRLTFLHDYLYLRRSRHGANDKYFYFTKREPKQKLHLDYIARTYLWIYQNGYKIHDFEVQKDYDKLIPDMVLQIEKDGKKGTLAVEVELSNNNIARKIKKYEDNGRFKKLLIFSNSDVSSNRIDIISKSIKELL